MHSRDRLSAGWSAIIDPDDEGFGGEEEAKTDPQIARSQLPVGFSSEAEKTMVDPLDPVTRALLEERAEVKRAQPKVVKSAPAPQPKLRLPLPGEGARKPGATPIAQEPRTPPPQMERPAADRSPAEPPSPAFSPNDLVEKLSESTGGSRPQKKSSFFTEYKEVVRAAAIGVVLLGGAIAYSVLKKDDSTPSPQVQPSIPSPSTKTTAQERPAQTPPPDQPPEQPVARELPKEQVAVKTIGEETTPAEEPQQPVKATAPMITIVSTPPGATVEINGEVQGRTPLILRSPNNVLELQIKLQLKDFKRWEQQVAANEAGHFTVNAQLEAIK